MSGRLDATEDPIVDPITLAVVRGALETTQREMTLTLEKTGRSSVFTLAHDYSNALFDHLPEMILQGQDIPIHLGSLIPATKAIAEYYGDDISEGDVIYHNDPAYMGSHILDCCMYKPVFYRDELVFWTVCKGHLTDIGGPVPAGYNPEVVAGVFLEARERIVGEVERAISEGGGGSPGKTNLAETRN